ncbi:hypothetical protein CDAR_168211 [Caerostris darwini]|uniref:Uncharacterized protein n=1 Tax=Caerostris darwini TaxID=1538125 RepID=A0AAV4T2S7_9ARAC|nr:hypothetical protein CDAR_168211 [Caerostris darwini]
MIYRLLKLLALGQLGPNGEKGRPINIGPAVKGAFRWGLSAPVLARREKDGYGRFSAQKLGGKVYPAFGKRLLLVNMGCGALCCGAVVEI